MALVYSSEQGRLCPDCGKAWHSGKCVDKSQPLGDGKLRIQRETKGRKGAGVTVISGLALTEGELKALLKQLKQHCGVGGALKDGRIELQGDWCEKAQSFLSKSGYVKK